MKLSGTVMRALTLGGVAVLSSGQSCSHGPTCHDRDITVNFDVHGIVAGGILSVEADAALSAIRGTATQKCSIAAPWTTSNTANPICTTETEGLPTGMPVDGYILRMNHCCGSINWIKFTISHSAGLGVHQTYTITSNDNYAIRDIEEAFYDGSHFDCHRHGGGYAVSCVALPTAPRGTPDDPITIRFETGLQG